MFFYMLGWGIIDPFLSIFIHNIVKNYSMAGLLYGLFFLIGAGLSVPVGDLADKANKIRYVLISLLSYPLLGVLYFATAFLGGLSVALLFVARALHGLAALFWVMVEGFIRRNSPKGETSATFGLYITFYKLAYVVAPIFSVPLIVMFGLGAETIHWLFLLLIPFPIVAALIISRVREGGKPLSMGIAEVIVKDRVVRKEIGDLRQMGFVGSFIILLGFFVKAVEATIFFLIPLYAFAFNLSLVHIALLFAVINLPYLFSFFFAEIADSWGKANVVFVGFIAAAAALFAIAMTGAVSSVFYFACLALGSIVALIQPAVNGLVTDITPRIEDGEMTGIYTTVVKTGGFASTIALGVLSDFFGLGFPFVLLAALLLAMAAVTLSIKRKIVVRI
jgi:MFS family permease